MSFPFGCVLTIFFVDKEPFLTINIKHYALQTKMPFSTSLVACFIFENLVCWKSQQINARQSPK